MIHREYIWLYDVFSSTSRPQITASPSLQGWNVVTLNIKKKKSIWSSFMLPCCRIYFQLCSDVVIMSLIKCLLWFWVLYHSVFCPPNIFPSQDLSVYLLRFFEHLIYFFLTCYQYCFNQETVETIGLLNDSECFCGGAQCNKLFLKAFHLPVSNLTDHGWVS